ncbi:hypothetical protein BHC45_08205 [Snodgrassella alvi]|nr:hypothetical protein BGH96_05610 [Snodgrassella alvi]PIT44820.1 hypothetical protein BHC45_08205 [Snodgrassella alvi]PIT64776.1 hypothetical protein BHC52_01680 [Snodgrassella alvi]
MSCQKLSCDKSTDRERFNQKSKLWAIIPKTSFVRANAGILIIRRSGVGIETGKTNCKNYQIVIDNNSHYIIM